MPSISLMNPETKQSALRPAVLDVVRQLIEITKIPPDTSILYPDDINKTHQPGSALSEDSTNRTLFPSNDKVQIDVEEDYDPSSILSTAIVRSEHTPIFSDEDIGVYVKPIYSKTNVVITFRYKASSRTAVERWRNDIRMRTSASRDINLHQVTYHYLIPSEIIAIIKEIHRLRENIAGYGDSFEKYFLDKSTTRLTELTNLAGAVVEPAISETQMRIVGIFDFEYAPEKIENNEDSEGWLGAFSYKFSFDKPIACHIRYPAMIHNQPLSTKFRPSEESYNIDDHLQSFSISTNAFNYFEAQLQAEKYVNFKSSVTLPWFDEFQPQSVPTGTVSIFSALCQVSKEDKRTLLDLNDLDKISIDSDILEFIKNVEWPYLTRPFKSILNVSLYRSMSLARYDSISIDSNLVVKASTDLDLRTSHRVRFSIIADLSLLDQSVFDRLRNYPNALVKVISAVNESLRNNPGFKDLPNNGRITRDSLFGYIKDSNTVKRKTVQITSVIAARKSN